MIKSCAANGIKISYDVRGEGEPLILIMGLGAHGGKWEPHVKAYEQHFKCYVLDNRGTGRSDKPEADAYSTEQMAEDVIGVMDAEGIASAHLHGISMGGAIAQMIAINHPERGRSMILTSTQAKADVTYRRAIELLRDSCGVVDGKTLGRLCQWIIFARAFQNSDEAFMLECEKQDGSDPFPMPAHAYKAQCNACIAHDALAGLKAVKAPTLIAAGDCDGFVSMAMTRQLAEGIKNSTLYVCPGGGHVHHWERLHDFNEITLNFLLAHRTEA